MSLTITVSSVSGYNRRTFENATQADLTIAVATDFSTAGERLTRRAAAGRIVSIPHQAVDFEHHVGRVVALLNAVTAVKRSPVTVNGAGNGVYTLASKSQAEADVFAYSLLSSILRHPDKKFDIGLVRSGGQTGYDVAFIKAALILGIPAHIHAARSRQGGILIRRADGRDVSLDEHDYRHEMGLPE